MKNILLTTTSLVLAGGAAMAETTVTWSGTAAAGVARTGEVAGVTVGITTLNLDHLSLDFADAMDRTATHASIVNAAGGSEATLRAAIALQKANLTAITSTTTTAASHAASISLLDVITGKLDALASLDTAAVTTSDFETYSEVNATVTGAVSLDNGMSLSASMSVDAGAGYNFKDDEGFDASVTGRVGLDSISLNAGALGTFKLDQNAVTHLVDADDDGNADLLYTNTFGTVSFSAAMDMSTDVDDNAVAAAAAVVAVSAGVASAGSVTLTSAAVTKTASDVQWSAKISMPIAGGTASVAVDEEGGNSFGASTTVGGIGVSFTSSLEAAEEQFNKDRSNTVGLTYVLGSVTAGASWNSVEDGDQWGISAAYAADGMTISASTDEGSDWAVSGSVALGSGASVVGGVNYTEDAYLGLSFAF